MSIVTFLYILGVKIVVIRHILTHVLSEVQLGYFYEGESRLSLRLSSYLWYMLCILLWTLARKTYCLYINLKEMWLGNYKNDELYFLFVQPKIHNYIIHVVLLQWRKFSFDMLSFTFFFYISKVGLIWFTLVILAKYYYHFIYFHNLSFLSLDK